MKIILFFSLEIQVGGPYYLIDLLVLLKEHKQNPVLVERLFNEKLRFTIPADWIKAFKLYELVLDNYFEPLRAVADSMLFSKVRKYFKLIQNYRFYLFLFYYCRIPWLSRVAPSSTWGGFRIQM